MMAVVRGVTNGQAGGDGESSALTGTQVMDLGFHYSQAKNRKAAIRMFSGFDLLVKCIQLSSWGRDSRGENTFFSSLMIIFPLLKTPTSQLKSVNKT